MQNPTHWMPLPLPPGSSLEVLPLDIAKIAQGLKKEVHSDMRDTICQRNIGFNAGIDALAAAIAKLSGNETVGGM